MKMKPYIYDVETYKNFFCCTILALNSEHSEVYIIDDEQNDAYKIIEALSNKYLIGYNNKTFDNVIVNYIFKNPNVVDAYQLHKLANDIIASGQKNSPVDFYETFKQYLSNDAYKSIDLMKMLFSKKLRVSLKELECSLNSHNVQELPYPPDTELNAIQKQDVLAYNMNDCIETRKVALGSLKEIQLRAWTKREFGVDGYSLDGVNLGVKILEQKLADKIGNRDFTKLKSIRNKIKIKDIIYPFIKFNTKQFNNVLDKYKALTVTKYFDEEANKEKWTKFEYEPQIGGYVFKYGLGGLHFDTKTKGWHSKGGSSILSIDVASYYPCQVEEYPEYCKPAHLPDEFIEVYVGVKTERIEAKRTGDKIKDTTLKLSINGAFGNMSNEYSWLYDVAALLAITVNGQLMLSMLCEKLMLAKIELIDVNTDGIYVNLRDEDREKFDEICTWWSKLTKMKLEETKFEDIYFLTTADYFGTTINKGKLELKEKGCFITENRLGKGMEFPVIYSAIKEHFLNKNDFFKYIKDEKDILKFCSFKKLKRDYSCFWKQIPQQRVNRFYASREGAHLYKRIWNVKKNRFQTDHVLKDSPVILLNRLEEKDISLRGINYPFYTSKARNIVNQLDDNVGQIKMF